MTSSQILDAPHKIVCIVVSSNPTAIHKHFDALSRADSLVVVDTEAFNSKVFENRNKLGCG